MSSDEPNLSDKVHILSTEDERLKTIGEILSSDSSRKILQLLFNQSFTANQIAQQTDMSLQLVIHHLKKMQSVGVVKITNVGKNTKSHDMKFYTIDKVALVILPSEMSTPAKKSKSLLNSFNRIHRLATLGGVSIAAWFSSQILQRPQSIPVNNNQSASEFAMDSSSEPASITADEQAEAEMPMMSKSAPEITADTSGIEEDAETSREISSSDDHPSSDASSMDGSELSSSASLPQMEPPQFPETISTSVPATGEPSIDIFWSVILVLGIIVAGLTIELAIKSKKESKNKENVVEP